jgi:hypothetical protein
MEETINILKQHSSDVTLSSIREVFEWNRLEDVFLHENGKHIVVRKEKINFAGNMKYVRRVFVNRPPTKEYSNVGWVVCSDTDLCMLCSDTFGYFSFKRHCWICGNIFCGDCVSNTIVISEYSAYGPVPACNMCSYGQVCDLTYLFMLEISNSIPTQLISFLSLMLFSYVAILTFFKLQITIILCSPKHQWYHTFPNLRERRNPGLRDTLQE